jgi:hypothetical protein
MAKGAFFRQSCFCIETVFTCRFWVAKEEKRDGKRTIHGILEGGHFLVVFLC